MYKSIFAISLICILSLTSASLPYDLQGEWNIAASWGVQDQENHFCPRAFFDVSLNSGFSFYWEAIDQANYKLIKNKSFYTFNQNGNQASLIDNFSSLGENWDILYFSNDMKTLVIADEDKSQGFIMFQSLSLAPYINVIIKQLNIGINDTELQLYPEMSCQFDQFNSLENFKAADLVGTWWQSAIIGSNNVDSQCMRNEVSANDQNEINFRFIQNGIYEDETYLPKPSQESFMIYMKDGMEGEFSGAVTYVSDDESFWIFMFSNGNQGGVFSVNQELTESQIEEIEYVLESQGLNVEEGYNFLLAENDSC